MEENPYKAPQTEEAKPLPAKTPSAGRGAVFAGEAGLVCAILAWLCSFSALHEVSAKGLAGLPFAVVVFSWIGLPLSVLGLVLCAIGISRSPRLLPWIGVAIIGLLYGLSAYMAFRL